MKNSGKETLKHDNISKNHIDSAFLEQNLHRPLHKSGSKDLWKIRHWHLGNCPNSAGALHFTQQGPLKIHCGSTGYLCNLVALNGSDSCCLHFMIKKIQIPPPQYKFEDCIHWVWDGFQYTFQPIFALCVKAYMTSQIFFFVLFCY